MYISRIEKAKRACRRILDEEPVSAEDVLKAIEDSYEAIKLLEEALNRTYFEGKAEEMELIAQIICGSQEERVMDKGCSNCYYGTFDGKAYPCSLCIRGIPREDMWHPMLLQQKMTEEEIDTMLARVLVSEQTDCGWK